MNTKANESSADASLNQMRARMTNAHRDALRNLLNGRPAGMSRTIQNTLLKWGAIANGEITLVGRALMAAPSAIMNCANCDGPGGAKTFAKQACMPINGRVQCIDWCIHQIVAALNAGGIETVASCCGHFGQDGRIDLTDGRVLIIKRNVVSQRDDS